MGCGCKKSSYRSSPGAIKPTSRIVSSVPSQVNAQQVNAQSLNSNGLSAERRKTQAVRRAAIRRSLNK